MSTLLTTFPGFLFVAVVIGAPLTSGAATDEGEAPPKVGEPAKDFALASLDGNTIRLGSLTERGPVVLVVLRGYPGYQCPICTRQVAVLRRHAADFAKTGARIVLVYPGPAKDLAKRAHAFLGPDALPEPMKLVLDPDYAFTNAYGLRWNARRETAYPSTFVVDRSGTVRYRKVSRGHGGRAPAAEVLKAVRELGRTDPARTGASRPGAYLLKPISPDFQRLAAIAGLWKGKKKNPDGTEAEIQVEYRLTSGNSALIERLFKDSPHEMVSVYHDDGDGIMMTHYCGLGNQPRMRASGFDKERIHFAFVDGSNMASPREPHMHALTITFFSRDHIRHEWEMYKDGKKQRTEAFDLTRVEAPVSAEPKTRK